MATVIVDAGPIIAYLKRDDHDHAWAVETFRELHSPLLTCDAVLGEAFFLLRSVPGGTDQLLLLLERGLILPAFDLRAEFGPIAQLMRRYDSVPMSLADACLVRMSELHRASSILTLDRDFTIYRKHRRHRIPVIRPA